MPLGTKEIVNTASFVIIILITLSHLLTWIKLTITFGSMTSGKRRMLKSEIATNAFAAVSSLPVITYIAKVANET